MTTLVQAKQLQFKLKDICQDFGWKRPDANEAIRKLKIETYTIKGHGQTLWLSKDDMERLVHFMELPEENIPVERTGFVISECRNKRFVNVVPDHEKTKIPVLIPRRHIGRLIRKRIKYHEIRDEKGVSYRHADFDKYYR